ncbi:MAG: YihA family ribosome biogenesis GTP-binding protein [Deltaproteobacteria bacterium]|nr:YihA family ribosome biogenesis GTP-binding protein [Deltaproteobacteria bacterium]
MMVKIQNASYSGTVYDSLPPLPEVVFAGRSNVGKSSLINALLGRKDLVKTSKHPGKTRNINYFRADLVDLPSFYAVDLPGYGYAKVSHDVQLSWEKLALRYFKGTQNLRMLLLLVDIRREMKTEELLCLGLVKESPAKAIVVATKADKLSNSERKLHMQHLQNQITGTMIVSSAKSRLGIDQIWREITLAIA